MSTDERPDDHILIDNGEFFEGTRDQFRDCFFDNANNSAIVNFCKNKVHLKVSVNGVTLYDPSVPDLSNLNLN